MGARRWQTRVPGRRVAGNCSKILKITHKSLFFHYNYWLEASTKIAVVMCDSYSICCCNLCMVCSKKIKFECSNHLWSALSSRTLMHEVAAGSDGRIEGVGMWGRRKREWVPYSTYSLVQRCSFLANTLPQLSPKCTLTRWSQQILGSRTPLFLLDDTIFDRLPVFSIIWVRNTGLLITHTRSRACERLLRQRRMRDGTDGIVPLTLSSQCGGAWRVLKCWCFICIFYTLVCGLNAFLIIHCAFSRCDVLSPRKEEEPFALLDSFCIFPRWLPQAFDL